MTDPAPPADPTADALLASLLVPTPDEWREAVRKVMATLGIVARHAPDRQGTFDAFRAGMTNLVEPVAILLAMSQPPTPVER